MEISAMNGLKMYSSSGATLAAVLVLAFAGALPATAATFTVNSTVDAPDADLGDGICADAAGMCTLRAAIMQANALGGMNVIDLSQIADPNNPIILSIPGADETVEGNPGTGYQVVDAHDASRGDLNITSSMDIIGAGSDKTIIEWSPSVKQTPAAGDRIFHIEAVSSNITVNISGVSIENGVTPPAQIIQTLQNGTYYQLERSGAGLAIGPAATVIYVNPGAPTGHGSGSVSGGSPGDEGGGGQHGGDEGGESAATITGVTLTDVKILNNQSGAAGGGISNAAPLTLTNVDVSGNSAVTNGGGIYNDAQLTVRNSTIGTTGALTTPNSAEGGGGIFDTGMHNTVIERSAIEGNKATGGGGLSIRSMVTMDIVNTTIDGNAAADVGGGMTSNGTVTLQNDTIADNSSANDSTSGGAGINAFGKGSYSFVNTLFQANSATGSATPANCGCSGASCKIGVMNSLGHNLADDATCALSGTGDLANTNAQLQALAGNGGPTETRGLLSGSPAVDAGDNANCPNTDQRGSMRPGA
jgi:CSLREA domain-containing protein